MLTELDLCTTKITDQGLASLKECVALSELDLWSTGITTLEDLRALDRLTRLNLRETAITDAGLDPLDGFPDLGWLNLRQTGITDQGLAAVEGLRNLHWLNLKWTKITDRGLGHLSGLTGLTELYLPKQITDAGLKHLASLTNLSKLNLKYSKVTNAGVLHLHGLTKLTQLKLPARVTGRAMDELRRIAQLQDQQMILAPLNVTLRPNLIRRQWQTLAPLQSDEQTVERERRTTSDLKQRFLAAATLTETLLRGLSDLRIRFVKRRKRTQISDRCKVAIAASVGGI